MQSTSQETDEIKAPPQSQDGNNSVLKLDTTPDKIKEIKTSNKDTASVSLTLTNIEVVSKNPSVIVLDNKVNLPIARIDEAYKKATKMK